MVLADELDKAVGARNVPSGSEVRFCGVDVLEAHACHGSCQVQEQFRDRITSLFHDQGVFRHAQTAAIFAAQVQGMRHHVAGEQAQAFGQMRRKRIKIFGGIRGRQVQQDARGRGEQDMRGVDGGRFLVSWRIEDARKATAGIGDTVERQTGISADKACGIAQCGVGGVKMGACCLGGEGGLSAKVQRFCRGNGARIGVGNACNRSVNLPRHKGGTHQRHGNAWVAIAVHLPSPIRWQH